MSWYPDQEHDTSLVTSAKKKEKQTTAWIHPDHFPTFRTRSRDHHDLIDNGLLAMTMAVVNMKTLLNSENKVASILSWMPFPREQEE